MAAHDKYKFIGGKPSGRQFLQIKSLDGGTLFDFYWNERASPVPIVSRQNQTDFLE